MDWTAFLLSVKLAGWTVVLLLPISMFIARHLAWRRYPGRVFVEAAMALPLVLPPTVLGYYLLVSMGRASPIGRVYESVFGAPLVFTFEGILIASLIFNLPFAVQPMQRAFEAISTEVRDAAACCGMGRWRILWRIDLPLAWPGIMTALVLVFAHTIGEFGVVLMVGGSIPGETRTAAIEIYDRVQAFDNAAAGAMSALLLVISLAAIAIANVVTTKADVGHN
ncbi:MAG: molybdate ABC transporter permease subunit [Hyphomicrobiaceae bacterium]|nr:molybdate ABC transporter permease subunit [Hyphomicrobiaceae bacterium]